MTVNLVQWRVVTGIFNCRSSAMSLHVCNLTKNFVSVFQNLLLCWHYFESAFIFLLKLVYKFIIWQCHGNIEPNLGPRKLKTNNFSVCHWNLNSLSAHSFSKPTQLKAIIQFINMISSAYLKHIWILQFQIIWLI